MVVRIWAAVVIAAMAGAAMAQKVEVPSIGVDNLVNATIGIQLTKKGNVSRFMTFDLTDGGNDILHGYAPQTGDVVEWYVRSADCADPDKSCSFELAIRKRQ